ncbi:ribonuclease H [Trifolium pratense]|uniref:Ribonuclease H n=1 Tax=Trifolium pratense TaxID=57577 RepID=A0A2K3KY66_TRIPR|nr:ribonuclease H [Trifolium pratense]
MQSYLSTNFTADEVHNAIKDMKGLAAPGPDGLPALFYHNYWDIVGKDVTEAVLNVLNKEENPDRYNNTHICLIPKIKNPITPSDYRPISLCNVIFKIITKTIANRLKPILPNIISHNQSAFVQDRLITDNTLVAFEIFNYFKHTNRKKGFVGIKTDMAKAYDRVEWNFLRATLEAMGFPQHLTNTILQCVTTVQFSILINGNPSTPFRPQRGLRQGDPLSPFLFIICADVLSGLITQAKNKQLIHGVKVANGAPEITHLLFADDSLFFCRATKQEATNVRNIILDYQRASGQLVNMQKSEIIFSKMVPNEVKVEVNHILPMTRVDHFSKYLGMPTDIGRSKQQIFNYIKDRVWKKLKGWKEKNLSYAGRGTLLKAVIQAIPTYIMSCFLLPKGLCKQIESMTSNFWWGSNTDKKKLHWINWKKMCKNKTQGGYGFRNTCMFNEALLAKQGWRIATQPDSLVAKVYKAKYFPKCQFMEAKNGNMLSYTWRSILHARWILQKGCFWTIGNGESVNIWKDSWLPKQNGFKVWSTQQGYTRYNLVKDLINPATNQWNQNLIHQIFLPFEANQILQLPLVEPNSKDELVWSGTKDGLYTVKSGYHAAMEWNHLRHNQVSSNAIATDLTWQNLWKLKIPPKHATLIWRILNHSLPVRSSLSSKGIQCNPTCPRCNTSLETIDHVFMQCEWAKVVWFGSPMTIHFNTTDRHQSFSEWLSTMLKTKNQECMAPIAALTYHIWRARNLLVFQDKNVPVMCVVQQAISSSIEYQTLGHPHRLPMCAAATQPRGNNTNWTPPPRNSLKLNVDAHPCGDGRWGLGMVLRTEEGKCVGAKTVVVSGLSDILDGEALGLNVAIDFAQSLGNTQVIIELDSTSIVDAVKQRNFNHFYSGRIARRGRAFLDNNPNVSINWVRRTGNQAADFLAKWALTEPNKTWVNSTPLCIIDIIHKDISLCNFVH